MKWVKISIGVVIAVTMVGFLVTSVYNLTQVKVKEEVVTFELLENNELAYNVFDKINEYAVYNDSDMVTNFVSLSVNDNIVDIDLIEYYDVNNTILITTPDGDPLTIYNNDTYFNDGFSNGAGDTIKITFEVTQLPILTGTIAIILGLVPLIFAGGVLAYMLNKQEF